MKRETYNGESAKSWHDAWETASRLHVAVMNDRDELQRQLDELRASVPVLETPPPQELTPIMKESIMKESMRLMNEVMALTVERDAILRRAEAAEADWQRCEAELKLRAPVEPPVLSPHEREEKMLAAALRLSSVSGISFEEAMKSVRPPVLSRAAIDEMIAQRVKLRGIELENQKIGSAHDRALRLDHYELGAMDLRDAILESLSQEEE